MTRYVLLILPEHDDEKPRAVGPFLAEHLAKQWANARDIAHPLRMIWPLEEVTRSVYGQGRHALIPSPEPRSGDPVVSPLPVSEGYELVKPTVPLRRDGGPEFVAVPRRDLAATGRPITSWVEGHADELQRFVPQELPERRTDR